VTRLLGVDLGDRRIGLAVADRDGGRAMPLTTVHRKSAAADDATTLARIIADQDIDELVVGLPLHASGHAGAQASATQAWVELVTPILGLPVTFRDERLTSHLAEQRVGPMKRGRSGGPPTRAQRDAHRARIDREAAAIILQDELDDRASRTGGASADGRSASRAPSRAGTDNRMETPK
jgi:putative Holliday junction resolvase